MTRASVTVDTVRIQTRTSEIKTISMDGRQDIFNHNEVIKYTEEKDGKITKIEGKMQYKERPFSFAINYAHKSGIDMGRVKVRKQGRATGELDLREEAFEFLHDLYYSHYVK